VNAIIRVPYPVMRPSDRRPSRAVALALLTGVAGLVVACGGQPPAATSRTDPPAATPSRAPVTAEPQSPPAATSPAPSPSGNAPVDRPDLTAVSVALEPVAGGLDQPVFVTGSGDGSGRLYVVEQPGRIRVVEGGGVAATPFVDLTDRIRSGGERGLLGLAFAPGFGAAETRVYVHYSGADDGETVVSELRLGAQGAVQLDPASARIVLTEPQPYPNHNGGWIGFDADGMLLVALGDGGAGGDPENRAADTRQLLGKVLRLDVLDPPSGAGYGIPADNPFADGSAGRPEILHYGLRNPFRSSVDPATGDLWIGDVGQGSWEEVDVARAGARGLDFGWRRFEGRHCYDPSPAPECDGSGITMPVTEYGHGDGCSVIGGVVYRGEAIPALRGAYLLADYCSGTLWATDAGMDAAQAPVTLLETGASVSSIGTGDDGEVYLTDLSGGQVLRLVPGG
jgi:glucose/arabinose dehydrogenase